MTYPEWQALMSGCVNPQTVGSNTWDIPIWLTIVRQTNGYSAINDSFRPHQIVEDANSYFDSGIHFYLCGVTYINNDTYYELNLFTELPNLEADVHALNSIEYAKGYVDVISVGSMIPSWGAYTFKPSGSYRGSVILRDFDGNTLAHELGHYFSLLHTFQGGVKVFFPDHPEYAQYVHDAIDPESHPVVLSTGTFGCAETGDYVCDTPADPKQCSFNTPTCDPFLGCSPGFQLDPLGLPYNPDPTLLMAYYACSSRFTPQQNQIMVGMLTGHPDWAFLYDTEVPTCQELPYDRGLVVRNCEGIKINANEDAPAQTPMEEVDLSMENINNFSCQEITAPNGVYITYPCVFDPPYNSTELLSLLPDVDYLSAIEGVTGIDLVLISRHILGLERFENPFQIIAADANNSANVTTFDIVELRKLILGIYNHLPNNSNWRYVPDYCFESNTFYLGFFDPLLPPSDRSPFDAKWENPDEPPAIPPATNERSYGGGGGIVPNATSWMDHVSIDPYGPVARNTPIPWSFTGIKVGDVNCSAELPFTTEEPDKNFTTIAHSPISANQIFTLQIKALGNTPISAWQIGIDFAEDSLQIIQVQPGNSGETFSLENFGLTGVESGSFRALNFSETGAGQNLNNKSLFKLVIRALHPIANIGQYFRLKNSVLSEKFYSEDGNEVENMNLYLEVANGSTEFNMTGKGGAEKTSFSVESYSLKAYPVPFSDEISFDFSLPANEQVHISLFDGLGRMVAEKDEHLLKGYNTVRINDLAKLTATLYWYSFESEGQTIFGKIVKN